MHPAPRLLCTICLWLAASPAGAQPCNAARALAQLYDNAMALELQTGELRDTAATNLLALIVPGTRPGQLVAELAEYDIPADARRIQAILDTAGRRAREVLSGGFVQTYEADSPQALELDWMADLIIASGCTDDWGGLQALPSKASAQGLTDMIVETASSITREILLGVSAIVLFVAVGMYRRSRRYREGQMRRQPRTPVSLTAIATLKGDSTPIPLRIVDLSLGGAKLGWASPPGDDVALTLTIGETDYACSVVWRNDFYAGVLFDTQLTKQRMEDLVRLSAEEAGAK